MKSLLMTQCTPLFFYPFYGVPFLVKERIFFCLLVCLSILINSIDKTHADEMNAEACCVVTHKKNKSESSLVNWWRRLFLVFVLLLLPIIQFVDVTAFLAPNLSHSQDSSSSYPTPHFYIIDPYKLTDLPAHVSEHHCLPHLMSFPTIRCTIYFHFYLISILQKVHPRQSHEIILKIVCARV